MNTVHGRSGIPACKGLLVGGLLALMAGCASLPEYEPITPARSEASPVAKSQASPGNAPISHAGLNAARQRVQHARALGIQANEAERFLAAAESAAAENDGVRTNELATRAHRQADIAINQYYVGAAEAELAEAREYANLSRDQYQRLQAGEDALRGQRAEEALKTLQSLNAELAVAQSIYTVSSGDSLWSISAKDEIYGNPYWWPLIYKNNAGQLRDPDALRVGQDLNIRMHPTLGEVNMAVDHAQSRGSWTVGGLEEADAFYLNQ